MGSGPRCPADLGLGVASGFWGEGGPVPEPFEGSKATRQMASSEEVLGNRLGDAKRYPTIQSLHNLYIPYKKPQGKIRAHAENPIYILRGF